MKFIKMTRPLDYPAADGKIPAGATGVYIAFRASPFTYFNKYTGKYEHLNVYKWHGKIYHAAR